MCPAHAVFFRPVLILFFQSLNDGLKKDTREHRSCGNTSAYTESQCFHSTTLATVQFVYTTAQSFSLHLVLTPSVIEVFLTTRQQPFSTLSTSLTPAHFLQSPTQQQVPPPTHINYHYFQPTITQPLMSSQGGKYRYAPQSFCPLQLGSDQAAVQLTPLSSSLPCPQCYIEVERRQMVKFFQQCRKLKLFTQKKKRKKKGRRLMIEKERGKKKGVVIVSSSRSIRLVG